MNYYITSPMIRAIKPEKCWHLWALIAFVWFWLCIDALTTI